MYVVPPPQKNPPTSSQLIRASHMHAEDYSPAFLSPMSPGGAEVDDPGDVGSWCVGSALASSAGTARRETTAERRDACLKW